MVRIENDCCDCAVPGYPCKGDLCSLRHTKHIYCDGCGEDITDEYYGYRGKEFCSDCILDVLLNDDVISHTERMV